MIERANPAALADFSGAMLGVTFCYCGSNIGEGPRVEEVIFAAGLRLNGFLAAAGLILGRSIVSDWVPIGSSIQALYSFGFPVLILLAVAILVEFLAKPTVERSTPSLVLHGLLPFLVYTGSSILYLLLGNFTL